MRMKSTTRAVRALALTPAQQQRLERLAREAGRTPSRMLVFVLRDGFELCEWEVRESRKADAETRRLGAVPNEDVQREARTLIDRARARKAA